VSISSKKSKKSHLKNVSKDWNEKDWKSQDLNELTKGANPHMRKVSTDMNE
jgi:hypothetical protein